MHQHTPPPMKYPIVLLRRRLGMMLRLMGFWCLLGMSWTPAQGSAVYLPMVRTYSPPVVRTTVPMIALASATQGILLVARCTSAYTFDTVWLFALLVARCAALRLLYL